VRRTTETAKVPSISRWSYDNHKEKNVERVLRGLLVGEWRRENEARASGRGANFLDAEIQSGSNELMACLSICGSLCPLGKA